MEDTLKCYEILEVEAGAPADRVRHSYIELSRLWDPERYISNPVLRVEAEKRRKEIEDAYQTLQIFLPELKMRDSTPKKIVPVDSLQLSTEAPIESSRVVLGILVAVVFLLLFSWALYLLTKGRTTALPPVNFE